MKKSKNIVAIVITYVLSSCLSVPVQVPTETAASKDMLLVPSATVTMTLTPTATVTPIPTSTFAPRSRVAEEAAVYSAILNSELEHPFGLVLEDSIFIIKRTYGITSYAIAQDGFLFESVTTLDQDTVKDFRTVNQDTDVIDLSLSVGKPYEYVSLEQLKNYPEDIWVIGFSKVGFNSELNQALAYMLYDCGTECGAASIYFLVLKDNIWEIEKAILLWE